MSTTKYRIMLIGCSKTKRTVTNNRKVTPTELYAGQLFLARVKLAEAIGVEWAVLSAKYGLWRSQGLRKPYDFAFEDMDSAEVAMWHISVAMAVANDLWEPYDRNEADGPINPSEMLVEIHAGRRYANPLAQILQASGIRVELPCKGMGIGQQLAYYDRKLAELRSSESQTPETLCLAGA